MVGGSILACREWSHPVWWGKCISWCNSATPLRDNQESPERFWNLECLPCKRVLWLVYVSTWPKFSKIEPFSWIYFFNSTDWKHPPFFFGTKLQRCNPQGMGSTGHPGRRSFCDCPEGPQHLLLRPWSCLALGPPFRPESYPSIFSTVSLYLLSRFLVSATHKVLNSMADFWLNDC